MNDPRDCDFDINKLDLSAAKLAVVKSIYDGPSSPDGKILVGYPFGGEDLQEGWGNWLARGPNNFGVPNAAFGFGTGIMKYFIFNDPDWSYVNYDFKDYAEKTERLAAILNANNPDLSEFRKAGGKLLLYHGWSDAALSALGTIDYVESVYRLDASAKNDVRLFMMPGVLHCAGGPGPQQADSLSALEQWEQNDKIPEVIAARFPEGSSRPLCAYPKKAVYLGGNDRDPGSFERR